MNEENRVNKDEIIGQIKQPDPSGPTLVVEGSPPEASAVAHGLKATVVRDKDATPATPGTQLAYKEELTADVENRRGRLSSDLLQQRHSLIELLVSIIVLVIIGLYLTFVVTIWCLFLSKEGFHKLPATAVILVGLTGSIPTILTISLMVGLFGKDKEEKSSVDTASLVKIGGELLKYLKSH